MKTLSLIILLALSASVQAALDPYISMGGRGVDTVGAMSRGFNIGQQIRQSRQSHQKTGQDSKGNRLFKNLYKLKRGGHDE